MNFKTTLTLLVVLVLLGGVALYVLNKPEKQDSDRATSEQAPPVKLETASVDRIVITPTDGQKMVIEKSGNDWKLTEPVQGLANSFAVSSLIEALNGMKSRGEVPPSAEYGLDQPRYVIEVSGAGKTTKIAVGKRQTVGDTLYVRVNDSKNAIAVGGDLEDQLTKPVTDFRQTKLVTANAMDIKQLQIRRPGSTITLHKEGEDWKMTEPSAIPAEASEVSSLTSAITSLNATEYVNEAEVPPQLRPGSEGRTTVWFSTAAPSTQPTTQPAGGVTVAFGGYDTILKKNVFVSVSQPPALAKVPASSVDQFNKKPLDLRDRRVLNIDPATVSSITIRTETAATTQPTTRAASTTTLTIERKKKEQLALGPALPTTKPSTQPATQASTQPALPPSDWALSGSAKGDGDDSRVDALLTRFHPLRAEKYLEKKPDDAKPAAVYMLTLSTQSAGGASAARHEIRLSDLGETKPLVGEYNGLTFEIEHGLLSALTGDFANKPKAPEPKLPPGLGFPGAP